MHCLYNGCYRNNSNKYNCTNVLWIRNCRQNCFQAEQTLREHLPGGRILKIQNYRWQQFANKCKITFDQNLAGVC